MIPITRATGHVLKLDFAILNRRAVVFDNPNKALDFGNSMNIEDFESVIDEIVSENWAGAMINSPVFIIFLKDKHDVCTYAHEVSHLIDRLFESMQIPLDASSTELRACLTDYCLNKYLHKFKDLIILQ